MNQRGGRTSLAELASALASREVTVQVGLEWLASGGQIAVRIENEGVGLAAEKAEKNPYLQAELFVALKGLLNESAAFRNFFATTASLENLLDLRE